MPQQFFRILRSILLGIALLCIALLCSALLCLALRSDKYRTFWRFPFRVKRGDGKRMEVYFLCAGRYTYTVLNDGKRKEVYFLRAGRFISTYISEGRGAGEGSGAG